jgi:aspartate ammonia-lyase
MNGSLDLNVMMPLIAHHLLESLEVLGNAARVFAARCVSGITANETRCRAYAERTASLVTAVAPLIGYDAAAAVFKKAVAGDQPIRQVILDEGLLSAERLDEILDLRKLTEGGTSAR